MSESDLTFQFVPVDLQNKIKQTIRDIPDFPKPGIMFKDITPILKDPKLSNEILNCFVNHARHLSIDAVVGIESRGFLFGHAIAMKLGVSFIPVRKVGKLPGSTHRFSYDLEYGSAEVELHKGVILPGQKILIHDDLLATGGTAIAAAELVKMAGGELGAFSFIVELSDLRGIDRLEKITTNTLTLVAYGL